MRSICPLSVPSSGEYVYVTAEPISLPYSRLLHPPDISLCPSTLLPPILFPLCVLSLCLFVPSYLTPNSSVTLSSLIPATGPFGATSLPLSLSLSLLHTHSILARDFHVWKLRRTGLPVDQYRYRYYSRVKRVSLIYSSIIFDDGGRRRGMFYIYI